MWSRVRYSGGESELIVGKAIAGRRDDVVLATKVSSPMGPGLNERGASRRWIVRACEESLRRLGTDHIDLYQVHRLDPATDLDETLAALSDLVRAGKIRYAGSSTFAPSTIVQVQWTAERRQRERFVCEQPPYSLLVRGVETDVLPTCETYRMGVLAWSPLAGGWLSGRWHRDSADLSSHRTRTMPFRTTSAHYDLDVLGNQAKLDAATELARIADEAGLTLIQLALAFVTTHPAVTAAIIGPRTAEHLHDQLSAADIVLEPRRAGPHRPHRGARHQPQPRRRGLQRGRSGRPEAPPPPRRRSVNRASCLAAAHARVGGRPGAPPTDR